MNIYKLQNFFNIQLQGKTKTLLVKVDRPFARLFRDGL
jgi:hypothetical protein